MERHLSRNNSTLEFDKNIGGCIWGLLPLQFHSFKKLMPHTRHKHERHSKDGLIIQSKESDKGLVCEIGNNACCKRASACVREKTSTHTSKDSSLSKCEVPEGPRLQRVFATRRLDPSSNYLDGLNIDLNESKHLNEQDIMDHVDADSESCETFEDFFDAFQIDKKLFLKNRQKLNAENSDDSPGVVESQRKVMLRRSSSCPTSNNPCSLTPSKLENKLTEVWTSSSSMDLSFSSSPPSSASSSSSTTSYLSHQSDYMLPRSRSMVCKSPVDIFGVMADIQTNDHGSGDYASDVRKYKLNRSRRASSLNMSLELYSHLLETSFWRDAEPRTTDPTVSQTTTGLMEANSNVQEVKPTLASLMSYEGHDPISDDDGISDFIRSENNHLPRKVYLARNELDEVADQDLYSADKLQSQSVVDSHEDAEDIRAANRTLDDFFQENDFVTPDSISLAYMHNALQQLGVLSARQKPTGFMNDSDNQLLSDLLNEAVNDVYDECDAFWPIPLCSNCHLHPPPPTEHHFFKKVQSRIKRLQSFSLKASDRIESVVGYSLANSDGWMNLQAATESLGSELDEMITHELIDELVYELMRDETHFHSGIDQNLGRSSS
ncbi:hypothetical protein QQ045_017430 [Rhodiola kirilowii]